MDWQLAAPTLLELILCILVVILIAAMGVLYSHIKQLRSALSESEHANAEAIARTEALAKNANNQQTEAQARTLVITRQKEGEKRNNKRKKMIKQEQVIRFDHQKRQKKATKSDKK